METVNKKAITPLMISFLLLSFAVAVGVFVTNLAQAQVEKEAVCPVSIDLRQKSICLNGNQITYTIQNSLNTEVNGLVISIIGTEEAKTVEVSDLQIAKGGTYSGIIPYEVAVSGTVRQIKITPKIVLYDEPHICLEQGIIIEALSNC